MTSLDQSRRLLIDRMGMRLQGREHNRYRFKMADDASPGNTYDLVVDPKASPGRPGAGTVHHIAFRTADDESQAHWRATLARSGVSVTAVRDRNYFRSIYFHAPEGVLFEIATDPPGFAVDETTDELGGALKLPDQLEPMRNAIEKRLPPLRSTDHRHVFKVPPDALDDGSTLVTLHGTGGSEQDLIPAAAACRPTSAILSPRGNVSENGMARFFKRLSNTVFDEADVRKRARELADFIVSTTLAKGRSVSRLIAMGYSNGANIAAAVMLIRPEVFHKAILLRPMMPLEPVALPDLRGKQILILRGRRDTVIPSESTDRLADRLASAGARVATRYIDAGHEITEQDMHHMRRWLAAGQGDARHDAADSSIIETV